MQLSACLHCSLTRIFHSV